MNPQLLPPSEFSSAPHPFWPIFFALALTAASTVGLALISPPASLPADAAHVLAVH